MKQLAQELGFTLDNLYRRRRTAPSSSATSSASRYTFAQMTDDLKTIWQQIHTDVCAASYPTLYNSYTARGQRARPDVALHWIENYVPGGHRSPLGAAARRRLQHRVRRRDERAELAEHALPARLRRARASSASFGKSNEKFHVHGGNDQVAGERSPAKLGVADHDRARR